MTTELFNRQLQSQCLQLPGNASADISAEDMEWQPSGADGFSIKPLMEDSASKLRTWLMKVDAGAYSPPHAHEEVEQIYVLEGSFYDQDKTYVAGDFIIRAPGAMHTAGSETGAIVFLMYCRGISS